MGDKYPDAVYEAAGEIVDRLFTVDGEVADEWGLPMGDRQKPWVWTLDVLSATLEVLESRMDVSEPRTVKGNFGAVMTYAAVRASLFNARLALDVGTRRLRARKG